MEFDDAAVGTLTMLDDTRQPAQGRAEQVPPGGRAEPEGAAGDRRCRAGRRALGRPVGLLSRGLPDQPGRLVARQLGGLCLHPGPGPDLARPGQDPGRGDLSPKPERLFRDSTKAWIADPDPIDVPQGRLVPLAQRARRLEALYHYAADGTLNGRVTSGEWEVRSIAHVDTESGWIYFTATRDTRWRRTCTG